MKLSICMMVKNEERYLKACLESLTPLRQGLEAELIIIDTGSCDRTVEIAQSYTDQVFFHAWNNDFAAMRNLTISYAGGEWILILDGDEVIADSQNILVFLNSKLTKEYQAAMVDIKNYVDLDKDLYSVLSSPRLFKKGNIVYEGAVHNQPIYQGPVIKLNDVVLLHYGYLANDQELMERKFERTAKLLTEQLKKDPENVYYRYQLSVSYLMHRDMDKALQEAEALYLRISQDKTLAFKHLYIYGHIAKLYGLRARYREVGQICEEGLQINAEYIDLWFYLHHSDIVLEQYEKGIKTGLKYLELAANYTNLAISRESAIVMDNLNKSQNVIFGLAYSCIKLEQDQQALDYLKQLDDAFQIDPDFDAQVSRACFRLGHFQDLLWYTQRFVQTDNPRRILQHLAAIEECRRQLRPEEYEKYLDFISAFARVEGSYGKLNAIRFSFEKRPENLFPLLDDFIAMVNLNAMADYTADLFYIMLVSAYPLADVLTYIREDNINVYFGYLCKNHPDFLSRIKTWLAGNNDSYTYSQIRSRKIMLDLLLENDASLDDQEYDAYFSQYRQAGTTFLRLLYNPVIIEYELINDLKNPEEMALLYLLKAAQCDSNQSETVIAYLEKARNAYAPLCRGIEGAIAAIRQQQQQVLEELQAYQRKVKESISSLIQQGKLAEAAAIIAQYQSMAGDDIEVYSMQAVVLMLQDQLLAAEAVLLAGLQVDPKNFDLLYNLGNLYERAGQYHAALAYYRRAQNEVFFESGWKNELDRIMLNLRANQVQDLQAEAAENEMLQFMDEVGRVLILEHDFSGKSLPLARLLNSLGIAADLVYTGQKPDTLLPLNQLVYRKMLLFYDLDRLQEYIRYYEYDLFYLFGLPKVPSQLKDTGVKIYLTQAGETLENEQQFLETLKKAVGQGRKKTQPPTACGINGQGRSLTIVIPTYNRPAFLARALAHIYQYEQIKPEVLILDSSSQEMKAENQKILIEYSGTSLIYREYDSSIRFFDKLAFALDDVHTPYVCMCADDDFLTEEGLTESLRALNNNPKLFSVKGRNLYFVKSMANLLEYDPFNGLYEQNAMERLEKITRGFVPSLIYQVFRTEGFRKLYQFFGGKQEMHPENHTFVEYLLYFLVIMSGPIGRINVDLNIRDKGIPREVVIENFPHAVVDKTFNANVAAFKQCIWDYGQLLELNLPDFDQKMNTVFCAFLINFLGVAPEMVKLENGEFNLELLESGMRRTWVWPQGL